ncbi:MAG TPA: prepilin-type N-terminal cleavage/methylation domain-containing protein [Candidatus Acidoferrum sp.]|nr:prepilin-type N-terminal cleavage/methylation domain-containing protein [Candidatus Acidoferrum sp.]
MKKSAGFTLIELVVAMTLTALLLGMLTVGLYGVVNDWQRDGSALDTTLDRTLVVLQLDRALQSAFPHSYIDTKKLGQYVYFEADKNSLSFVSTVSPQRKAGLTAWYLTSDDKKGVQLKQTPAFADDPRLRLDDLDPVPLLPEYTAQWSFLLQKNADTKEWVQEWSGRDHQSLPIAVHLTLTPREKGGSKQVLEILAPIRVWRNPSLQPIAPTN